MAGSPRIAARHWMKDEDVKKPITAASNLTQFVPGHAHQDMGELVAREIERGAGGGMKPPG
jgi:dihydroxyacid dehydratase/phosphogluconate dehydratase